MMDREVLVYVDLLGEPRFVGRLWSRIRKGREGASFEYSRDWLSNSHRFALEPALSVGAGVFHTAQDRAIFGSLGDSAPDRWGRLLMRRAERQRAQRARQPPRTLFELDFLLMVDDQTRQGALRFKEEAEGPFLRPELQGRIPPLVELPRLLSATERFLEQDDSAADLALLLAPGSSLGGARPKASIIDTDGQLSLAKFPAKQDDLPIVDWESVALQLAQEAGIAVPDWRRHDVAGKTVLLLRRFDRAPGTRIPYLSAMSMLGRRDNEPGNYLELADAIQQYGARPEDDLRALWRRIVFNVLISNTDDHLRNHGFLYQGGAGWTLSPAFDLNPVPTDIKPRVLSTAITHDDPTASVDLAMEVAEYFRLSPRQAKDIAREVGLAVKGWRSAASACGLSRSDIERMESAFEHQDLRSVTQSRK